LECVQFFSRGTPQEGTVQQTSSNVLARNNGPNKALEYVQAYVDALTITRGTLEDHLAKLKGPQEDARCRSKKNHC
jgi:hypothetical protein